tara:strand:- start:1180 stop:1605 length:426 start_codon:yes stop_codon:yes gene_type:complete
MKRLKEMTLQGSIGDMGEKKLLDNTLSGIGWKIEKFEIIIRDTNLVNKNTACARLSTASIADPTQTLFDRNDVIGIATYGGGGRTEMIDNQHLITNELYLQNITRVVDISDPTLDYQITLGQYQISDLEHVVSLVKQEQAD